MDNLTDIQIADLLGGEEPQAQQRAAALAAALRQQQAQAQSQQFMAGLAGNFNNPGATAMGRAYGDMGAKQYEAAGEQLQQIPKVTEQRLQRALEAQKNAQQAKYQAGELALKRKQLDAQKFGTLAPGGQVYNLTTGELGAVGDVPKPPPSAGGASAEKLDKSLRGLREDIDPSSGRGAGLFGKDQALVTSAQKLKALVDDGKGGRNYNLTVRQIPELVQSVASMLSSGNQAAQAQLEHLAPQTAGMDLARKMEWLTGHPEVANVPGFVQQYIETADREEKLAKQRIRDVQLRRLPMHQGVYSTSPNEMKAAIRQYLPDLSDADIEAAVKGTYRPSGAGGLSPEKQKRLEELRARKAAAEAAK